MRGYYECHITMDTTMLTAEQMETLKFDVEHFLEWSYSEITDDPILGPGSKAYATKHFNRKLRMTEVYEHLKKTAEQLHEWGYRVGRAKIEAVVYDAIRGRDFAKVEAA